MRLDIEREPFAPSGGIDGRAARRAMGKPDIEFWELFLRETLQNSWDAKLSDSSGIAFSIDAMHFSANQAALLNDLFAFAPVTLAGYLQPDRTTRPALIVSDRKTRGLGGVTRADKAADEHDSRDYVDFLRNVGRASTKALGGGTYGFGKGVLYDASAVDSCLIYSQIRVNGLIVNRLVGSCVREQFELDGLRYTGRHWWGKAASDGVVDPMTGPEARALAESLGIARLGADETGTVVAVLDPKVPEGESLKSVVERLVHAARHWAWPHMVDVGAGPTIEFAFSNEGVAINFPDPSQDPVLQHFVRAYERALPALTSNAPPEHSWPWTVKMLEMLRPARTLGVLAYRKYATDERTSDSDLTRHVALMRNPRFVVKYLPVAEDPDGQAIAGVFIAASEVNDDFARSEPVAHDDWVPDGGRSLVRVALKRIADQFKIRVLNVPHDAGSEHASGVAQVSRMLGSVLAGVHGPGGELQKKGRGRAGGGGRGNKAPVTIAMNSHPQLLLHEEQIYSDFYFKVSVDSEVDLHAYVLKGAGRIVLDGGAVENPHEAPFDAEVPVVSGWFVEGQLVSRNSEVPLGDLVTDGWCVLRLTQPRGAAITAVIESASAS